MRTDHDDNHSRFERRRNSTATTAQSTASAASQQLAGNYDTFLQMLTTQLQNQDPLNPLDSNSFTQELVQFAGVEQQINTNSNLQTLISLQASEEATQALQMLGDTVTINSGTAPLSNATNTPATWNLSTTSPATGTVTITNSSGAVVYTGTVSLNSGNNTYKWNGQGNNGTICPDGNYTISVSATSANGQKVTVTPQVQGVVSSINVSQNPPVVTINGQTYPISDIVSISSTPAS